MVHMMLINDEEVIFILFHGFKRARVLNCLLFWRESHWCAGGKIVFLLSMIWTKTGDLELGLIFGSLGQFIENEVGNSSNTPIVPTR